MVTSSCADSFCDSFDGNEFTLKNYYLILPTSTRVGLFSTNWWSPRSTISNMRLENFNVSGASDVGTLCGNCLNSSISNVVSQGSVMVDGLYGGGLVGRFGSGATPSTMSNSFAYVNVIAHKISGGSCSFTGGMIGGTYAGTSITDSGAYGNVIAASSCQSTGGFVGDANGAFQRDFAFGHVIGDQRVAGFAAFVLDPAIVMTDISAYGNILESATTNQKTGGLIGATFHSGTATGVINRAWSSSGISSPATTSNVSGSLAGDLRYGYSLVNSFSIGREFSVGSQTGAVISLKDNSVSAVTNVFFRDWYTGALPCVKSEGNASTTDCNPVTTLARLQYSDGAPMNTWSFNDGAGPSSDIWAGFDADGLPVNMSRPVASQYPAMPTDLSTGTITSTSITISWTDRSSNETGFLIERSSDGGVSWVLVTTTVANATSFPVTGLTATTNYEFRVSALNGKLRSGTGRVAGMTL